MAESAGSGMGREWKAPSGAQEAHAVCESLFVSYLRPRLGPHHDPVPDQWSPAIRRSGNCWPPPTRSGLPADHRTRRRSTATTKPSEPAWRAFCGNSEWAASGRLKDRQKICRAVTLWRGLRGNAVFGAPHQNMDVPHGHRHGGGRHPRGNRCGDRSQTSRKVADPVRPQRLWPPTVLPVRSDVSASRQSGTRPAQGRRPRGPFPRDHPPGVRRRRYATRRRAFPAGLHVGTARNNR
jgi:hypothetical protein